MTTQETQTATQVADLWNRYFDGRSLEDRNRLVLYYSPLVRLVANRISRRVPSFQSMEELCSCGQFGLINAVERFDPSAGFQFATYATVRIQGSIIDELRRDDILPKRMRAKVRTFQVARETLELDLHRTPTLREVASYLGVSLAEVREYDDLAAMSNRLVSLSMTGEDPSWLVLRSTLDKNEEEDTLAMRESVKAALLCLTQRQREVLVMHYLEGFQKSEIADVLGIDRSRVTQLIHQGLRNLRAELGATASDGSDGDTTH